MAKACLRVAAERPPFRRLFDRDDGVDPDAKEALCFAVLAHETVNGVPTNLPSVTGASAQTILGSISVPQS